MRKFRKYEFGSKSAATAKINALGVDDEGRATHDHAVVCLGHIVTTPAVYDDAGEVTEEAVLSSNYHVDVMWYGEPDEGWNNQMIWTTGIGVHSFGSSSANAEYLAEAKVQRPDLYPEPSGDENAEDHNPTV